MPHSMRVFLGCFVLSMLLMGSFELRGQETPPAEAAEGKTAENMAFFEKHIRPLLIRECYECHAATSKEIEGGLTLDTREGIRKGGDSGPAVVPGNAKKSLLLKAVRHESDDLKMPPKKKLDADSIALLEKWINIGAPDPREGAAKVVREEIDIEKGRKFWAFQPPQAAALPEVKDATWPRQELDRFILAALEAKGLSPVADADPPALLRRLSFDLVGLPPTPEEVQSFEAECAIDRQAAIEHAADRLLALPQFGERWGRHWLDVARYAESSGRSVNFAYPQAWRYRDYVFAAFNKDKPFNRFIREQLAGDLLMAKDEAERAEFQIATGFLAIGPKTLDERNRQQFQMDLADEQIDATFQTFQALTVACARCHDHKFDPIPQRDYYALAGIFRSTETCYGTLRQFQNNHPSPIVSLSKDSGVTSPLPPMTDERKEAIEKQMQDVREQIGKLTPGQNTFIQRIFLNDRITLSRSQLAQYDSGGTPRPQAMGVREAGFGGGQDARLLVRGELSQPGETVRRGFPQVLTTRQPNLRRGGGSGRRELASFIASEKNPLTARVMANRIWLHLLGRGLVSTPDNFGASGQLPSHPELLDYLAVNFIEHGWSVKTLIRQIVLSRSYQLGSQYNETNYEADPDNVLVWRQPKRRLEAEALRDSMLAVAGRLNLEPPQGSSIFRSGEGNATFRRGGGGGGMAMMGRGGFGGDPAVNDTHRTAYMSLVRDGLPEVLVLFDFPDPSLIIGERATTTVPAQSLYLLNNPFVIKQAEGLADKLLALDGESEAKLKQAYLLCYSRPPSESEINAGLKFLEDYGRRQTRRGTWTALCHALFASSEFAQR